MEFIHSIANLVAIDVILVLQSNHAILLPEVYDNFQNLAVKYKAKVNSDLCSVPKCLPKSRWLLTYLNNTLGSYMRRSTKHKKYGVVIHRANGDLLNALSKALGEAKQAKKMEIECRQNYCELQRSYEQRQQKYGEQDIIKACRYINTLILQVISSLTNKYSENPGLYTQFNVSEFAKSIHPTLLMAIQLLTQPTRSVVKQTSTENNRKLIKQIYSLMVLCYCTNNQCYMPLHYLLTDAIQCHGGSVTLIKIFNRVGACASIDTLQRIQTLVAAKRIKKGPSSYLNHKTLSIVSIDNIDILQPWVMVSSLHANRSWHMELQFNAYSQDL